MLFSFYFISMSQFTISDLAAVDVISMARSDTVFSARNFFYWFHALYNNQNSSAGGNIHTLRYKYLYTREINRFRLASP